MVVFIWTGVKKLRAKPKILPLIRLGEVDYSKMPSNTKSIINRYIYDEQRSSEISLINEKKLSVSGGGATYIKYYNNKNQLQICTIDNSEIIKTGILEGNSETPFVKLRYLYPKTKSNFNFQKGCIFKVECCGTDKKEYCFCQKYLFENERWQRNGNLKQAKIEKMGFSKKYKKCDFCDFDNFGKVEEEFIVE